MQEFPPRPAFDPEDPANQQPADPAELRDLYDRTATWLRDQGDDTFLLEFPLIDFKDDLPVTNEVGPGFVYVIPGDAVHDLVPEAAEYLEVGAGVHLAYHVPYIERHAHSGTETTMPARVGLLVQTRETSPYEAVDVWLTDNQMSAGTVTAEFDADPRSADDAAREGKGTFMEEVISIVQNDTLDRAYGLKIVSQGTCRAMADIVDRMDAIRLAVESGAYPPEE